MDLYIIYMKTAFKLPKEYSNADFILFNEYAVEESIKERRNLFRTIKISHDNDGNTREEKQFTLCELHGNLREPHKINSCITLNNNEHKRAWELFLEVNRSLYSNETESGMNLKRYLNSVMLVFESWFGKHALKSELLIKRLIHNRNFNTCSFFC